MRATRLRSHSASAASSAAAARASAQGLTPFHFTAQRKRFRWYKGYLGGVWGVLKAGVERVFRRLGDVLNLRNGSGSAETWTSVNPCLRRRQLTPRCLHRRRRLHQQRLEPLALPRRPLLREAAQVEIECENRKQFIMLQVQAVSSRRIQRGFDRVNLHRPTSASRSRSSTMASRASIAASC